MTELDPSGADSAFFQLVLQNNCIPQLLLTPWYPFLVTAALASVENYDADNGHESVLTLLKSMRDIGATVPAGAIALEVLGVPPLFRGYESGLFALKKLS